MTKRVGDYELGSILGQGAFGIVRQATNLITKEEFAIKIIDKEKVKKNDLIESLKKEIQILMMIDHPNIVRLIEVLASKTKIYLVLEWIKGGELFEIIKKNKFIEESLMRKYFRQIVRAIQYCQSKQIAHRDLKPENILICSDSENLKVNDFGLSSLYLDSCNINNQLYTTCGTVHYLAPEVIQSSGYDGHKADIWSLGVILFFGCAGYLPFEDDNVAVLLDNIISGQHHPFPKYFTKELKDLIVKILITHPNKRIPIDQIISHPWFQQDITPEEIEWFKTIKKLDLQGEHIQIISFDIKTLDIENLNISEQINLRKIKGIELISFLTGKIVNQLPHINGKSNQIDSCFTLKGEFLTILKSLIKILQSKSPLNQQQIQQKTFKLEFQYKKPVQINITLEIMYLINQKFLISLSPVNGTLQHFSIFMQDIYKEIRSLQLQ